MSDLASRGLRPPAGCRIRIKIKKLCPSVPARLSWLPGKVPLPSSAFSRGLVTGLLVAAVAVAAILFHDYRRQFGETLIEWGERFAAKPQAQTIAVSLPPPGLAPGASRVNSASRPGGRPPDQRRRRPFADQPENLPTASDAGCRSAPRNIPTQPETQAAEPFVSSVKLQPAKVASAAEITAAPTAAADPPPKLCHACVPADFVSNSDDGSVNYCASCCVNQCRCNWANDRGCARSGSNKLGAAPKLELTNQPGIHTEGSQAANADSSRELYFEVGKFKNLFQARDETDRLAQLGFPVTSVEQGHLWANSVHVLVGPYGDEDQAKATHENLLTSGFKPRPFEKGWRNFTLVSSVMLNGARTPEGDYVISWESYIGDANVKFLHNHSVIASAGGRWVKRDAKYPHDAYLYRRNPDGSRTLLEIHFGGMRQALVFGKG